MKRFMLLMHGDAREPERLEGWEPHLRALQQSGQFEGGSSLGAGHGYSRTHDPSPCADGVVGYLLIRAGSLEEVVPFLTGNPVYEAGGTVEIRELIED